MKKPFISFNRFASTVISAYIKQVASTSLAITGRKKIILTRELYAQLDKYQKSSG